MATKLSIEWTPSEQADLDRLLKKKAAFEREREAPLNRLIANTWPFKPDTATRINTGKLRDWLIQHRGSVIECLAPFSEPPQG